MKENDNNEFSNFLKQGFGIILLSNELFANNQTPSLTNDESEALNTALEDTLKKSRSKKSRFPWMK